MTAAKAIRIAAESASVFRRHSRATLAGDEHLGDEAADLDDCGYPGPSALFSP